MEKLIQKKVTVNIYSSKMEHLGSTDVTYTCFNKLFPIKMGIQHLLNEAFPRWLQGTGTQRVLQVSRKNGNKRTINRK